MSTLKDEFYLELYFGRRWTRINLHSHNYFFSCHTHKKVGGGGGGGKVEPSPCYSQSHVVCVPSLSEVPFLVFLALFTKRKRCVSKWDPGHVAPKVKLCRHTKDIHTKYICSSKGLFGHIIFDIFSST